MRYACIYAIEILRGAVFQQGPEAVALEIRYFYKAGTIIQS
jgi:hypothetical protein